MVFSKHPKIHDSNHPRSRGFTLIEIMLVVVIILIATGIAVPRLSGSSGSARMKDAVRSTVRVARYARSMAILKQTDCTLSFATNRISLTTAGSTNDVKTNTVVSLLAQRRLADKIRIAEFENLANDTLEKFTAVFYSSGMNDGFDLTLEDDDNRRVEIKCNPITGKVTVDE